MSRYGRFTDHVPDHLKDTMVSEQTFYMNYHGHTMEHLNAVLKNLKGQRDQRFIYFAGDSTLDNKYWFHNKRPAINGYEHVLSAKPGSFSSTPHSTADVCYWVNKFADEHQRKRKDNFCCINTAIEATTLTQRTEGKLFDQDKFIRDNITENDVLVCCIGGNDVALAPNAKTIFSGAAMLAQSFFTKTTTQKLGTGRFIEIFGVQTQDYIEKLVEKTKPKLVVVCMVYFLDENPKAQSWAGMALSAFRYNSKPEVLQGIMRQCYEKGTQKINIKGTKTVYLPLFEFLDGKNSDDYCMRVEPSCQGGEKLGKAIVDKIVNEYEFGK